MWKGAGGCGEAARQAGAGRRVAGNKEPPKCRTRPFRTAVYPRHSCHASQTPQHCLSAHSLARLVRSSMRTMACPGGAFMMAEEMIWGMYRGSSLQRTNHQSVRQLMDQSINLSIEEDVGHTRRVFPALQQRGKRGAVMHAASRSAAAHAAACAASGSKPGASGRPACSAKEARRGRRRAPQHAHARHASSPQVADLLPGVQPPHAAHVRVAWHSRWRKGGSR